jgi:ATP-dependent exoDNAse (exonuclease V) beta subunit
VLQAQGIRASTEQPGLLARPEIVLALACLRRLNDASDTIATAEIVSLAECEDPEVWLAERLTWLESGAPRATWRESGDAVHPIFHAIQRLREQRSQLSPAEAVHLVLAHCQLARCVLQWHSSSERARLRLANLDRLAELAAQYEDACRSTHEAATLSGFLLWLQDLAGAEGDTMPQPAIDAVQVMTHHKAKGLEWPVVVLMDLASDVKDSLWDAVRAESAGVFDVREPLKDRFLRYWPWPYGAQSKVPVADSVAASPAAQTVRAASIEEHRRLLYVSMTRARDVLILARQAKKPDGEWMATIGLGGFLPKNDTSTLTLRSRHTVPFIRRHLSSGSTTLTGAPAIGDLNWFEMPLQLREKLPLTSSPSQAAPVEASVADSVQIGTRIAVDRHPDAAALGEAVHACLAAYLASGDATSSSIDVAGILERMGVAGALSTDALLRQLAAVRQWLEERWPDAGHFVEIPVTHVSDSGQVMSGRIDLLLKTQSGWILIDYKSGAQNSSQWNILAATYGGQLSAYSTAVEAATGVAVRETWLALPIAATALRVLTESNRVATDTAKVA